MASIRETKPPTVEKTESGKSHDNGGKISLNNEALIFMYSSIYCSGYRKVIKLNYDIADIAEALENRCSADGSKQHMAVPFIEAAEDGVASLRSCSKFSRSVDL